MPHIQTPIGKLNYVVEGVGPAALLLHPIGTDLTYWDAVSEALARQYRVLRIDAPGHGDSEDMPSNASMHDCAEAIHVVQHSTGAVPARVIGLSLGGMFAQQLALDFPSDVEALLLVGTTSSVAPERRQVMLTRGEKIVAEGMESMVEESVARWVSPDGQDSVLAERVRAGLRAISPRNWANTWRVMADFDALSRLDQLRVPTLVMNGTADASTPPSVGAVTAAAIPGARQIAITDGAHFFPFEHPERFLPRTLEFLASIQTNHR